MTRDDAIEKVHALIDTYHAMPHPAELRLLYEVRRDLTAAYSTLTRHVKQAYGSKALTYVYRKYAVAREIAKAQEDDAGKVKSSRRPFNALEVRTEALDHVLQRRKEEVEAEAQWEELEAVLKAADRALGAMSQELADGRRERDYQNYLESLQKKEQTQ